MRSTAPTVTVALALLAVGAGAGGCKKSKMDAIEAVSEALSHGDGRAQTASWSDVPRCDEKPRADRDACLGQMATALGSTMGFRYAPIDQAGAAAAGIVVVRDHRADILPGTLDDWSRAMSGGKGPGGDVLRMATARRMAEALVVHRDAKHDDESEVLGLLRVISESMPGGCETYSRITHGTAIGDLPPELHPDHSACVQKDLGREGGPGGTYGYGVWRAAEGALAAWREQLRSLHAGLSLMTGDARDTTSASLGSVDSDIAKVTVKKVVKEDDWIRTDADPHDAGLGRLLLRDADATPSPGPGAPRNPLDGGGLDGARRPR